MNDISKDSIVRDVDFFLDITQDVCPMTFVMTKLLLERMAIGQTAAIRLHGDEALENVPRSVREHGHTIFNLSLEVGEQSVDSTHLLVIRKEEGLRGYF